MTRDQELWGVALDIIKRKGDQALEHVAERLEYMEATGEDGGVALWREIEARVLAISEAEQRRQ